MNIVKCPFCEIGHHKRHLIWRLTNNFSLSALKELLKNRGVLEPIILINHTGKRLILHFATGPCTDKKIILETPEGSGNLDPKKVAGAIYFHKEEKNANLCK